MEEPGVDCSGKICGCALPAGLGREVLRQGWESSCSKEEVVAWWHLEDERGSHVHPFPGKINFHLVTQKRGERDGGRTGELLSSGGTTDPPLSDFPREKKYPCVHNQP